MRVINPEMKEQKQTKKQFVTDSADAKARVR